MSDPTTQQHIEEFMRKSLLGEELVNTQFHLFSARSSASDRVVEPRVLCANNHFLAKSSEYFLDLLSSDVDPSDTSLLDLADENEVPNDLRIDDYGYGSDSDLNEYPTSQVNTESHSKDDTELSKGGSESVDMSSQQLEVHKSPSVIKDGVKSVESNETVVQGIRGSKKLGKDVAMRLRSLGSRHILIKDTAFQTWYTLLNYLYTGKITVLPLSSSTPGRKYHECSTSSLDKPRCSAKSMYRLACKTGLDDLRNKTFSFIRGHLTEQNILKELSSRLVSEHPELLEMELDILYSHIASPAVVVGFPAFARRIASGELPHGAEIIVGIHTRVLKKPHLVPLKVAPSLTVQVPSNSAEPAKVVEDRASASNVDKHGVTATAAPRLSEINGPTAGGPSLAPASTAALDITPQGTTPVPTTASAKVKAKAPRVSLPTANFVSAPTTASPAPILSTVTSKPVPEPASVSSTAPSIPVSSTTALPLFSQSAQSFGKPAPTSSTTSSFLGSNLAPNHTPSTAPPPPFGLGAAPAPAFGSSSTPNATSSFVTGSAFSPGSAEAFAARFAAALSESSSLRASKPSSTFFGPGQATGDAGSRRVPTFSFAQRDDDTTENQKKPAVSSFTFGPLPSKS